MDKVEPPRTTGTKDVDQADDGGAKGIRTRDIWKNSLENFAAENHIAETELKEFKDAVIFGMQTLNKKLLRSSSPGGIPGGRRPTL